MTSIAVNRLGRMLDDLRRSLEKPVEERSWIMAIDIDRCIGCFTCWIACLAENVLPPGVSYRVVREVESGDYPDVRRVFMPTNCQQCDDPPCVEGLPSDAYTKRPDGILVFHYEKLRGEKAYRQVSGRCPYTAVYYDDGRFYTERTPRTEPYETRVSFEYGERWSRDGKGKSPVGAVRKCHFCLHRLESGMLPACVTTCLGGAMYFGDRNDPKSLVSEVTKSRASRRINEEEKTAPRVVYLTGTVFSLETCAACHG